MSAAEESRRRCARGAADEPPPEPAGMTPEQAARSADQTATILRGLAAAYEAARLETWIAWYCEPDVGNPATHERCSDLAEGRDGICRAIAMYIAHGMSPGITMERDAAERYTAYGRRACVYLARVAEHARAALQGEPAQIPSSDGLGPYPPPSAP